MPRVPYTPDQPHGTSIEDAAIISRVRGRRLKAGHPGLIELDRQLLHAPPVAAGWNEFLGAIRTKTTLPDDMRELIICRVAALNHAHYEWAHHVPLLRDSLLKLKEVKAKVLDDIPGSGRRWDEDREGDDARTEGMVDSFLEELQQRRDSNWITMAGMQLGFGWTSRYKELVAYVDAMTLAVKVPDEVFKNLRGTLKQGDEGNRQMVEITATCAAYNCVSRFLVALDVGDMNR